MAVRSYQLALAAGALRLSDVYGDGAGVVNPKNDIPYRQVVLQASGAAAFVGFNNLVTSTVYGAKIDNTFTGPGNFSAPSNWSFGALPAASDDFAIKGACTFDSGAPTRAYGSMTLGGGGTAGALSWESGNSVVLEVTEARDGPRTIPFDGVPALAELLTGLGSDRKEGPPTTLRL